MRGTNGTCKPCYPGRPVELRTKQRPFFPAFARVDPSNDHRPPACAHDSTITDIGPARASVPNWAFVSSRSRRVLANADPYGHRGEHKPSSVCLSHSARHAPCELLGCGVTSDRLVPRQSGRSRGCPMNTCTNCGWMNKTVAAVCTDCGSQLGAPILQNLPRPHTRPPGPGPSPQAPGPQTGPQPVQPTPPPTPAHGSFRFDAHVVEDPVRLEPAAPAYQRFLATLLKLLGIVLVFQFLSQACSPEGGGSQMFVGLAIFVLGPMIVASWVFGKVPGLGGVVQGLYSWMFRLPGRMAGQRRSRRQAHPAGRGAYSSTVSVLSSDGRNHLIEYTAIPGTVRMGDQLTLYGRRRGGGSFRCYRLVNHTLRLDLWT